MTVRKNPAPGAWLARALPAAALVALIPAGAIAHPGHGPSTGFVHGFLHFCMALNHPIALLALGATAGSAVVVAAKRHSAGLAFRIAAAAIAIFGALLVSGVA